MNSIKLYASIILFLGFINLSSQTIEESIISNLQGINQEDFTFLDANGYKITIYNYNKKYSPKTIKKLKRKFDVKKKAIGIKDSNLTIDHQLFSSQQEVSGFVVSTKTYVLENGKKKSKLIQMSTSLDVDSIFESVILNLIVNNKLPGSIFTSNKVDSIKFGNRFIKLGPICRWMEVRNIQCPNMGQLDWSEFRDKKRAIKYMEQKIKAIDEKPMSEFIKKEDIKVVFEGTETDAKKYALKIKLPKLVMGGSNILIIYFIVGKVDEKFIACTMSYYTDDINTPKLPPLISEIIKN